MISIRFVYNDGKDVRINLPDDCFQEFFNCLNDRKPYWDKSLTQGFWTNIAEVRFVEFVRQGDKNESKPEGIGASNSEGASCEVASSGEDASGNTASASSAE